MTKKRLPRLNAAAVIDEVRAAIFDIEPELRQIDGMLALLMILGESAEPVEPKALAALVRTGHAAFDELSQIWRHGLAAVKKK